MIDHQQKPLYKYSSSVTSPTVSDGNHLKQIYDLYR